MLRRSMAAARQSFGSMLLVAGVAALGALARLWPPLTINHDCGWYLFAGGRILDGAQPYVDVVDVNPPLILYLNAAVVALARGLGLAEIAVFQACVLAVVALSLALCARTLATTARTDALGVLAWLLLGFAGDDFGQREHLLAALMLPWVLLTGARGRGDDVPRPLALTAGALAGLGGALKPFYLLVALIVLAPARGKALRRPEQLAFAAVLLGYALHFALLPGAVRDGFVATVDLVLRAYGAYNQPLGVLLVNPSVLAALGLGAGALLASRWLPRARPLALASLAALLAALWQRKGWPYHLLPALTFGAAAAALLASELLARTPLRARGAALLLLALAAWGNGRALVGAIANTELRAAERAQTLVRELAAGGAILALDTSVAPLFPTVNYTGLDSTLRYACLWPLAGVYRDVPADAEPFRYATTGAAAALEQHLVDALAADLERRPPALIVVRRPPWQAFANPRFDVLTWLRRHPRLAEPFAAFRPAAETAALVFYTRVD
jgi:hypothetical protein